MVLRILEKGFPRGGLFVFRSDIAVVTSPNSRWDAIGLLARIQWWQYRVSRHEPLIGSSFVLLHGGQPIPVLINKPREDGWFMVGVRYETDSGNL